MTRLALESADTAAPGVATANTLAMGTPPHSVRGRGATSGWTAVASQTFRVIEEHARGGMGQILVGEDAAFDRRVAVKVLLVDHPELRARFDREARITATLQHPGIVPVYAAGEHEGRPFYVMRLVGGKTLAQCFSDATDRGARLALLPQLLAVVETIAYAHKHGVLHRDLKPQNVMIGEFGEAIVLDWGLGKLVGESETSELRLPGGDGLTEYGETLGTPAYMPLEQAQGQPVDATADVYALGAILYELFEGRPPYVGRTASELIACVLDAPPPPLSSRGIAPELVTIVTRAMARDSSARYPDAGALAEDLRRYLQGQLVGAHHYSLRELFVRWLRRHRAVTAVAVLGVVALAVTIGVSMSRLVAERDRTEAQRVLAEQRRGAGEKLIAFAVNDLRERLEDVGQLSALDGLSSEVIGYYKTTAVADDKAGLQRVQALAALGGVAAKRGKHVDAIATYESALALVETLRIPIPFWPGAREQARKIEQSRIYLLGDLASSRVAISQVPEARRDAERGVAAARDVVAWNPGVTVALTSALNTLFSVLQYAGDQAASASVTRELVQLAEAEVTADPTSTPATRRLALALYQAAAVADESASRSYITKGLPLIEELARTSGDISDRSILFGYLQILASLTPEANREQVLRRALSVAEEVHRVDSQHVLRAALYIDAASDLAADLHARGRSPEAREVLQRLQPLTTALAPTEDSVYKASAAKYEALLQRL